MNILAIVGIITICAIVTVLLILTLETFKDKRALKWVRIGDEVKEKGLILPTMGIVISINYSKRELHIIQLNEECIPLINKVRPAEYKPTGVTYSREELKRRIPEIEECYYKNAEKEAEKIIGILNK
ncbi:hypothetical protein ACSDOQ_09595 [Listeria monocytogenes]